MSEIEIFKDFFNNFGGQATTLVIAYMVFKLSIGGFITFGANQSIKALVKLLGTDVPKSKLDSIYAEHKAKIDHLEKLLRDTEREAAEKQADLERLIHINKCLQEGKINVG